MKWDILNRIQLSVKVPRLLFLAVSILLSLAVMLSMVRDQDRQDEAMLLISRHYFVCFSSISSEGGLRVCEQGTENQTYCSMTCSY